MYALPYACVAIERPLLPCLAPPAVSLILSQSKVAVALCQNRPNKPRRIHPSLVILSILGHTYHTI